MKGSRLTTAATATKASRWASVQGAGFRPALCRSKKSVSVAPAWKSGWANTRAKKWQLRVTPNITVSCNAWRMREIAKSRLAPCTTNLASIESKSALTVAPCITPLSNRTPGPWGSCRSNTLPVSGTKPASASSAKMRHSMALPCHCTCSCRRGNASPWATRNCHSTKSKPVTISVTGCSTCRRVFISKK